jgi:transposase
MTARGSQSTRAPSQARNNTEAILRFEKDDEKELALHHRIFHAIGWFFGTTHFLSAQCLAVCLWVALNSLASSHQAIDPYVPRQHPGPDKAPAEQVLKDIRRQTRRQYSAEEKIRIVLEGLRGEENISELCRREGIAASMYYGWSKEFLEAGKRRLAGDTARAATSGEVKDLRREAAALKEVVADLTLENRLLKKSMSGDGENEA